MAMFCCLIASESSGAGLGSRYSPQGEHQPAVGVQGPVSGFIDHLDLFDAGLLDGQVGQFADANVGPEQLIDQHAFQWGRGHPFV